jgi:anthranilate phosphoribosyltransferase
MNADFPKILARLIERSAARQPPYPGDVSEAFESILAGSWTPVQVGAFAVALRMMGDSPDTIAEAATVGRRAMSVVEHDLPVVVDTCGTGGDGAHTLNISSAAAVLVAACGLPVAKHGNRSASSRCGSADVFEAMGIPLDVPTTKQSGILREAGIAFLFAPAHHPALRHAGQARGELKTRTIFNVLGPLLNPARANHSLVGVYDDALRPVVARALGRLGVRQAWVVHGEDGLDEVSPCGPTRVSYLSPAGEVRELVVTPEDFGIARLPMSALAGGDAADNARALGAILDGQAHPARDAAIINAAAALAVVTGELPRTCAERVRTVLEGGIARRTFDRWKSIAIEARGG